MDSYRSSQRRPKCASKRPSAAVNRSSTSKRHDLFIEGQREEIINRVATQPSSVSSSQPSKFPVKQKEKLESTSNALAPASPSVKPLVRQKSPMNPYNKFECPKIPSAELVAGVAEKLVAIQNNLQPLECDAILKTPIESCSCPPMDTPNEDEAVRSTVIGLDECCRETWKRKEFYYRVKSRVERAVKRHKICLIRGDLPKLSRALEERGWLQKYESIKTRMLPYSSSSTAVSLDDKSLENIKNDDGSWNERALIYTFLRRTPPDFIWDCRNDFVEWDSTLRSNVLLNRFQRSSVYTSKLGMAHILQEAHWLHEENVSTIAFPRSFNPSRDASAFLADFRRTAAVGLLKWLVMRVQNDESIVELGSESIPISRLEFAVKRCEEFLADEEHEKIDQMADAPDIPEEEWRLFLEDYSRVLHKTNGIANSGEDTCTRLERCYLSACTILKKLRELDHQYELSGMRNIWILKPSDLCCGTGISISHSVKDIFRRVEAKPKDYFIVQKYIERPLLIQETKFDIRAWYLVTSAFPLTIWLFEEALLRFSSKPYSFVTYHEAIHLCNTAIQQKYDYEKRRRRRRGNLGDETMDSIRDQGWDCTKLNEYLKQQGYNGEPYYDTIYPKMSQAIVLTMLAAQEHLDCRHCSFELYGADFMVLEDLSVWLIEINTNPRMHPPSSRITQRLYDSVLESLVKVVMDLPMDPDVDTGGFKLAFKQNIPEFIPYHGPGLFVFGKPVTLHEHQSQKDDEKGCANICSPWSGGRQGLRAWTAPPTIPRRREPIVVDFIDYLNSSRCTVAR